MATKNTKQSNAARAQKAKVAYQKGSKERAETQQSLKAAYLSAKDDVILLDILSKARSFSAYHTKMAQDGVGVRKTGFNLENNTPEVETVYYTGEKRLSELDKSAGQLELIDYIERQITPPVAPPVAK